MKVLMTADAIGGVWTYAIALCHEMNTHGIEMVLVTMGSPLSEEQRLQVHAIDKVTVHESTYKLEWMEKPWDDVDKAGRWLLQLESEYKPDIIHLNGYVHASLPWKSPVIVVAHSCVLSWWQAVKGEAPPSEWDHYAERVRLGLDCADAVVAPSAAMLGALTSCYGPRPGARVIWNGLVTREFGPQAKMEYVVTAGRLWDEAKNLQAITRVAPLLTWPVYVAGERRSAVGENINTANMRFLGRLTATDLKRCFAKASIFALPAHYEPFGLTPLEAALSGCALVLGDIPSLREIWLDNAIYVHPNSLHQLRDALQEMITNGSFRSEMAERARNRAKRLTAWRMAKAYMTLYEEVELRQLQAG